MKELTCIICPRGCCLTIDDENNVFGNFCPRGKEYAINELTNPTRNISSSVRVRNRENTLCSVKTSGPIPKDMIFDVMNEINKIQIDAPTTIGEILIENILGLNVNIVVTKNME